MTTTPIVRHAYKIVAIVCMLIIAASAIDLHCTAIRTSDATFVLACRASRLEAPR